jgi:uncharacterized protein YprB with RNaseH-like and TPR domain
MNSIAFDIETTGFDRKKCKILAFAFAEISTGYTKSMSCNELSEEQLIHEINGLFARYARIITWNGDSFDVPFLVERGQKFGIPLRRINHIDLFQESREFFGPGPKNLLEIAKSFNLKGSDRPYSRDIWLMAERDDEHSIDYIKNHCEDDVIMLRSVWKKIWE